MDPTSFNTLLSDRWFLNDEEYLSQWTTEAPDGSLCVESVMSIRQAREFVERARGRRPADWLTSKHLGTALHITGDSKEGLIHLRRAVEQHRSPTTMIDLAIVLDSLGRFDEALELSREAYEMDNENQFSGLQYSNDLLRQGRLYEGFSVSEQICWDAYWYRELKQHIPRWEGEALAGKRLLVVKNGGYGDNILFYRQFLWLKYLGAHVTYACPAEMVSLFMRQGWIDAILGMKGKPKEHQEMEFDPRDFDCFIPMMSITHRLGPETLGWPGVYMECGAPLDFGKRGKPLVGICWTAGEIMDPRKGRSLSNAQVCAIVRSADVDWISLSYGCGSVDGVADPEPAIGNWLDTADAIAGLDLVVTVDTGVAHLAGAMGKPVWVVLPTMSAWMYFLSEDSTPSYPTARLFRSAGAFGISDETVARLCGELGRAAEEVGA